MTEVTYLPEVECTITVRNGILDTQVVAVADAEGNHQFLRVGKGEVVEENDKAYLPVWVVQLDHGGQRALVELPSEADSGTRRMWIPFERFSAAEGRLMILSEREIQALLDDGLVLIDPRPPADSDQWSSTAVDLTLDGVVLEWTPPREPHRPIQPHTKNFDVQGMMEDDRLARKVPIHPTQGYVLKPQSFILGFTRECIRFPARCRIAARVEGKSSLARLGLCIHVTAPTIHAGFGAKGAKSKGLPVQLEIFNLGPWEIQLDRGMRICQLIFEEVREVPTTPYRGQFSDQRAFKVPTKRRGRTRDQ